MPSSDILLSYCLCRPPLNFETTLGVAVSVFDQIKLAQMLNSSLAIPCVLGSIKSLDVQSISLDMDIHSIKVSGLQSKSSS